MATRKVVGKAKVEKVEPVKVEPVEEKRENIKAMDFVPVWQKCESAEEVNEHFGRTNIWASAFASRLRKMGVKLKSMPRGGSGRTRLDVDELNALID